MGFFHSTTSQLATVSLLLALCVPVTCHASALTASVTHECSLTLTPSKVGYNSRSQLSVSRGTSSVLPKTLAVSRETRYQNLTV